MGLGHDHGAASVRHEKPLAWALALTGSFLVIELVAAWLTNSLALLSDAAHMATDTLALVVALVAVRMSRRPPDARRTFGYVRLEALGALLNGGLLFLVAGFILWEAWSRLRAPPMVATTGMIVVALAGMVVNLVAMRLLQAGSSENLNVKGAYLEVWSDLLGSIAVLVGAIVIAATGWRIVDPILAVGIGLWVLPRTWALLREAVHVLLEGVPKGIELAALRRAMQAVPGVASVHDLHVWSLSTQTPALAAHVVLAADADDATAVRHRLQDTLAVAFAIRHVTLQIESAECATLPCEAPGHADHDEHAHGHDHEHGHHHP